ncbi:MAG: hypothetical protein K2Y20_10105 [Sphingomonas sp.]|nr:hypothetical protein [Sphingomonas sp.]
MHSKISHFWRISIFLAAQFALSQQAYGQQQSPPLELGTPGQPPIPTLPAPDPIEFADPATTAEYNRLERERAKIGKEYSAFFYNKENIFLRYCLPYFDSNEERWLQGQSLVGEYIRLEMLRRKVILSELEFATDLAKRREAISGIHIDDLLYYLKSELKEIDSKFIDEINLIRRGLLKDRCLAAISGSPLLPDTKNEK